MRDINQVDLGAVQIHKKVIGDIAAAAIKDIPGVSIARFGLIGSVMETFGYSNYPGVSVRVDPNGQISIIMRIILDYGINVPTIAHIIQDKVHAAVLEAVDIELKEINVNIQAVERS